MLNRVGALIKSTARNLPSSFSIKPFNDILFVSEGVNWVTSWEIKEVALIAQKLGISTRHSGPVPFAFPRQATFFANKFVVLLNPSRYLMGNNRIAFPYYHGYPDSGDPLFNECLNNVKRYHKRISRIQVTHSRMQDLILSTGIDPVKIFMIPIGINVNFFPRQTPLSKGNMRKKYKIPGDAVVIGSFQKDGNGWEYGEVPKLVKGPDLFLKTIEILKERIPELFILLSGPARGYVKNGLEKLNVPYRHIYLEDYPRISELYHCLDLYIIAAREEGGPKAVLESMSSGIPLVTTKVGQAMDLVEHCENGWMVDVGDVEGLAYWAERSLFETTNRKKIIGNSQNTAQSNSYRSQIGLWNEFFRGFVETD